MGPSTEWPTNKKVKPQEQAIFVLWVWDGDERHIFGMFSSFALAEEVLASYAEDFTRYEWKASIDTFVLDYRGPKTRYQRQVSRAMLPATNPDTVN